ncbi:DinB family protein [Brevibacillus reuszeri]|uniref:DinB family protein n=1 Tax=Brevibacillus reuszeri TaxID=54915 RepID=UPI003D19B5BA
MSQSMIHTAVSVRQIALQQVQAIPEELFDVQPQAFANTIRWNVGHLVFALDYFLSLGLPFHSSLPEDYTKFFHTGTKPADWTLAPPTKAELVQYMTDQLERLAQLAPEQFEHPLLSPIEMGPLRFEIVGEVVNFALVHEAMHLGTISSLAKVIQHERADSVK